MATTATTRRDLFGAAGFTALAGLAGTTLARTDSLYPVHIGMQPDRELLALHDRFFALHTEIEATFDGRLAFDDPEELRLIEVREELTDRQEDVLEQMGALRATTLEGHRARAEALLAWHGGVGRDGTPSAEFNHLKVWPLIRDLLAGSRA